ncbi:MAG: hypothetical protein QOG77_2958 [Solirubrobacteraceae bacterium]|jgi:hypothetical protein|nr:hypothetical protein [Solirubrobacteraceae bacterium]
MKRHPALAPLSRDHHHALVAARALFRATPQGAAGAAQEFLRFWEADGCAHFRLEDEILLPAYACHGDPGHPVVVQALVDHMTIRRDAGIAAAGAASLETLRGLGAYLAAHVRLEERELFPLVERTLPEADLAALGARLAAAT